MTGKINRNPFTTIVDSGSPVTAFEIEDTTRIMQCKTLFNRHLPEDEEYVDFHMKKLNLPGYVVCQIEVGNSKLQKGRVLVASHGAQSLIGRDWLNAFNYRFVSPNQKEGKQIIYKLTKGTTKTNKLNKPSEVNKLKELNTNDNNNTKNYSNGKEN